MAQTFENPANGYRESISGNSSLWVVLFGMFYLIYKGLWAHVFIWFLLVTVPAILTGGPGIVLSLPIVTIGYAIGLKDILRRRYLSNGWKEVNPDENASLKTTDSVQTKTPVAPENMFTRKCPFCAEEIKIEAIRCRHCQAELS